MDYDLYDALLHHIFKQVRLASLLSPYSAARVLTAYAHRRKATRGSSPQKRTLRLEYVSVSPQATFVSSPTKITTSHPSKLPFAI